MKTPASRVLSSAVYWGVRHAGRHNLSVGLKGFLRLVWAAAFGGGLRPNSVDPETGQTNYGFSVGRQVRARLEAMDAENPAPLSPPMAGDLGVDFSREFLAPPPPPMMP